MIMSFKHTLQDCRIHRSWLDTLSKNKKGNSLSVKHHMSCLKGNSTDVTCQSQFTGDRVYYSVCENSSTLSSVTLGLCHVKWHHLSNLRLSFSTFLCQSVSRFKTLDQILDGLSWYPNFSSSATMPFILVVSREMTFPSAPSTLSV